MRSIAVEIDVRERASVERAFAEALAQLGGCEILAANAGVSTMGRAIELTGADWDFNFAVNARGMFLTNQIAARHFVTKGAGCIVNTASRDVSPQRVIDDYVAQTPLGRLEEPEDVADVVVFLCSDQARFMTGQGINVTGGVYMT